ncbi:MAG TPA: NAD-binding protein [Micromonosporaceae bacterium]|nr:NAD-binding protein [Micromonosporaceae bacterium]
MPPLSLLRRLNRPLRQLRRRSLVARLQEAARANGGARRHYVVCGSDPLAYRLIEDLVHRYGVPVTAVVTPRRRADWPDVAEIPGIRTVRVSRVDEQALRGARLESAAAIAFADQDDIGNIHLALLAREINPRVRLVVRMFNMRLGEGVTRLFADRPPAVLSDAEMAAPEFVAVALGEVDANTIRLHGRTLFVTRRRDVPPSDVVCGLADTSLPNRPDILPGEVRRANIVLARSDSTQPQPTAEPVRRRRHRRRPVFILVRALRGLVSQKLQRAALALVGLVAVAGVALALRQGYGPWEAIDKTLLTAISGATEESRDALVQVLQLVLVVAGIALVPVLTAAVVEGLVNARLAVARGRLQAPIEDHVIVVGLGNVGTRVIKELHDRGVGVVAIDKDEHARGAVLARQLGIPLIVGDASQPETLNAACVHQCRALVVLSTDDVSNLEAALHGRAVHPQLRVVLRLFDGDFAQRVQRAFSIAFSRSVSYLAAPAFAAAMMEQEIVQTIPIERHVLLIAEVSVGRGAALDGAAVTAVDQTGAARVIALARAGEPEPLWTPGLDERLSGQDRLTVVATRDGLNRTLARAAPPATPEPAQQHGPAPRRGPAAGPRTR